MTSLLFSQTAVLLLASYLGPWAAGFVSLAFFGLAYWAYQLERNIKPAAVLITSGIRKQALMQALKASTDHHTAHDIQRAIEKLIQGEDQPK